MTYLRALSRVSLVTFAAALLAAACGDSAKDPAIPGTGSNVTPGGNGNIDTATGANNPAPGGAGSNAGTGTNSESGPGAISLNTPGRDPSLPINLAESGAVGCGGRRLLHRAEPDLLHHRGHGHEQLQLCRLSQRLSRGHGVGRGLRQRPRMQHGASLLPQQRRRWKWHDGQLWNELCDARRSAL